MYFFHQSCQLLYVFVLETPIKIWEKKVPLSQGLPDI